MCKITFLMDVYNGEAFVDKSIESVLNQTEKNIKLYIRNNGSKDQSDKICRQYAQSDSRITYLENRVNGVTEEGYFYSDRQFWPDFSSEYISIIGHDDILDADFASTMYSAAKKSGAQMTVCGNISSNCKNNIQLNGEGTFSVVIDSPQKLNDYFSQLYYYLCTLRGKLFETSWFEEYYHILTDAPDDNDMSTDTYGILNCMKYCKCLTIVSLSLNHSCIRNNSETYSAIIKREIIKGSDVQFYAAKNCLEHYKIATVENINFLFQIHWGHICEIMKNISVSPQISTQEKILSIQEILNSKSLMENRNSHLKIIWDDLCVYLHVIIPDFSKIDSSLWEYYLVKLYFLYLHKENKDEALPYTFLLSALCDPQNKSIFGIELLKDNKWECISSDENLFKNQPERVQRFFLKNPLKLKEFLSGGDPKKYMQLEDELANAVENENYEKAGDLLSRLNENFPLNEYAFYYRIYLSDMIGDHLFAVKQAYAAKILWRDSKEIMELCQATLSAATPIKQWIPMKFEPDYLNTDIAAYEEFTSFSGFVLRYSFVSLILYAAAQRLKTECEGEEGKSYSITPDYAKKVTQTIGVNCFKTPFEGGATLYDSISDIKKHIRDYQHLYSILNDDISKSTLTNLLLYRFTGANKYLKKCSSNERQYYLPELLSPRENEVFVDCGAYDGGTVKEYIKVYGTDYKQIYAYEPAPENYRRVCSALSELPRVQVENKGVADKEDTLKFTSSLPDAANRIHPLGDVEVQITFLDQDITEKIDFIKMDIEGMEQAALLGAKKHIREDHPCLAICVYHLVEDLWKIPKLIENLNPNQKFYLRYHLSGEIPEEMVFYACPVEY